MCTIYALSDPREDRVFENVRYVGKTQLPLAIRLKGHLAHRYNCYKTSWIKNMSGEGVSPDMWPLSFCNEENWKTYERQWIKKLKPLGRLTNLTDGGDGNCGRKWTDEQRKALSISKRQSQKPFSPEHRAKISAAIKGTKKPPFTERQLRLMREAKSGNHW